MSQRVDQCECRFFFMGQASLSANALESATGLPRFRIPERAFDLADPIKKVDEAVRAVLAELKGPPRSRKESDCQVVVDRLFSLRHAEALPPGTRIVQLGPATVVTPLARDLLKRKGITIRLGALGESLGPARGPGCLDRARALAGFPGKLARGRGRSRGHVHHVRDGTCGLEVVPDYRRPGGVGRGTRRGLPRCPVAGNEPARGRAGRKIDFLDQATCRRFPRLRSAPGARDPTCGEPVMRIAEVIGRVTLSRLHPSLRGGRFLVAVPLPLEAMTEGSRARGEELVVYDNLGAGLGALIGVSEGREAANPFGKTKTPVDAFCACLIDQLSF